MESGSPSCSNHWQLIPTTHQRKSPAPIHPLPLILLVDDETGIRQHLATLLMDRIDLD
jgi:hypothetical protein